ncbi:hypothetical protein [Kitasatospora sp. NPDC085464]|uniref:hypothetical protein n=1 Tax=Kitasatospora sp. NPDC085464 TaxID=3364063 RepID=UPI0037CB8AD0
MTADRLPANARLLHWALSLYPASYGDGARAEIAHHAGQHIAGTGRLAGLREVADVAGYGARVRLGLVPHRPPGQALATAAPLAAVLAGTYAAWHLWSIAQVIHGEGLDWYGPSGARVVAVTALMLAPAALMAVAVLAGRWTAARCLALVAVVAASLLPVLFQPLLRDYQAVLLVFNAAVVLVAPPDRTSHPSRAVPWAVALSIMAGEIALSVAGSFFGERALHTAFDFVAPVVTGVAIACTARAVGQAALATAVLAGPPLLSPLLLDMGPTHLPLVVRPVVLFTAGYAIAFVTVRLAGQFTRHSDILHR